MKYFTMDSIIQVQLQVKNRRKLFFFVFQEKRVGGAKTCVFEMNGLARSHAPVRPLKGIYAGAEWVEFQRYLQIYSKEKSCWFYFDLTLH